MSFQLTHPAGFDEFTLHFADVIGIAAAENAVVDAFETGIGLAEGAVLDFNSGRLTTFRL